MKKLRITLRSDLCAGSGESFGNSVDTDICISDAGLPYIPARRLKGCLRAEAVQLKKYGSKLATDENIQRLFGGKNGFEGILVLENAVLDGAESMECWLKSVNADPSAEPILKDTARPGSVASLFSYVRGQTKMQKGVSVDGTLRYTRVLNHYDPLHVGEELVFWADFSLKKGSEDEFSDELNLLKQCCMALRHIGLSRNRGLGNIKVVYDAKKTGEETVVGEMSENEQDAYQFDEGQLKDKSEMICITYHIHLDAPVTLPGCSELISEIPARSVIGCMSTEYLRNGSADEIFSKLFLDGTVQWSSLTPVISGKISAPTPLFLVNLKNEKRYANCAGEEVRGKKQKTLEGTYAVETKDGYTIAKANSHTVYHHTVRVEGQDGMLYMQQSLDAGMIYGGTVTLPKYLAENVWNIIVKAPLRFGRSRTAQYAACSIAGVPKISSCAMEEIIAETGEPIYVVLQSDLILSDSGVFAMDNASVRDKIAMELGLNPVCEVPADSVRSLTDRTKYHVVSGYHSMWQLQKPQLLSLQGGSVFCFISQERKTLPRTFRIGEFKQEGFGVCHVLKQSEINKLQYISKGSVDRLNEIKGTDKILVNELRNALLMTAARHAAENHALQYAKSHADELETGLIGRLRLMTDEAENYEDLLNHIESIKDSDESSETEVSRKLRVKQFVQGLCGLYRLEADRLIGNCEISNEIGNNKVVQRKILGEWKSLLLFALHIVYYEKGGQ